MLDAALQTLAAAMPAESLADSTEVTYLPVSLETIRVFGDVGRRARCRAELVSLDDDGAGKLGRITLMDEAGTSNRRDHRHLSAARRAPNGAIAVGAEDLRHRLGGDVDRRLRSAQRLSAAPAGSWLVLSEDSDTKAIVQTISRPDSAHRPGG